MTYKNGSEETFADNSNNPMNDLTVISNLWDIHSVRVYDESIITYNKLNK